MPEWHLQSFDGKWYRHNKLSWAVMVFYPADDTPGCTRQLEELQAHLPQFQELGAQIFGLNPAEAESHQAFAEKLGLETIADMGQRTYYADADGHLTLTKEEGLIGFQ